MQNILKEVLSASCFVTISVYGTSMHPFIRSGEKIRVKKTSLKNLKIGDIIFYKRGDNFFVHRLILKTKNYFITKGDNFPSFDKRVEINEILGKVVFIEKNGRWINLEEKKFFVKNYFLIFYSIINIPFFKLRKIMRFPSSIKEKYWRMLESSIFT